MRARWVFATSVLGLLGCVGARSDRPVAHHDAGAPHDAGAGTAHDRDGGRSVDAGHTDAGDADAGVCPRGHPCHPIAIASFPFTDTNDTRSGVTVLDRYDCADTIDESGPELYYRVVVPARGVLSVSLDDVPGDAVDVDLHLLRAVDDGDCLARANVDLLAEVDAGEYFLVADSYVDDDGNTLAGAYTLTARFTETIAADCTATPTEVRMFWRSCDASVPDCFEQNGEYFLRTPTTGPVVKEAHLVTDAEDFGGGWPASSRDRIDRHYAATDAAIGRTFARTEPWAPAGEGGSMWGQGSTGRPIPVVDEAWYINMYWRDRPARGTRMLVTNPANGRTVVTAAGYETGPGANTAVAGVAEEVHLYLGTTHRSALRIGFAADQTLPLGPVECR